MPFNKTNDEKTNKGFEFVDRAMRGKQEKVKTFNNAPNTRKLSKREFVFAAVSADSEGPGSPTANEGRIYYKDDNGVVWKFVTTTTV